jgi:DNA-binding NarL/FixJ family response regulator
MNEGPSDGNIDGPSSEGAGPDQQIRVLLVDDQALLRMGFRMILEVEPDMQVVGEAGNGRAGVSMAAALQPDVVLMDIRMPGLDGIAATRTIVDSAAKAGRAARVLILTTFDLDAYVYDSLRAGASGFLLKDAPPHELLAAIRTVAGGAAVLAPTATRRLIDRFVPLLPDDQRSDRGAAVLAELTDREQEVFRLLAGGRSNREIADELHLSEGTVKIHVGRILAKLDLRDRVQAVVLAYETGLVRPAG